MKRHYVSFHGVDSENYFFQALFKKSVESFCLRKCYQSDEFVTSRSKEIRHNFLKHYQEGGEIPHENRHFNWISDGKITKFTIEFEKHADNYDFKNPNKLIDDFFNVVNINFRADRSKDLVIKSSFSIQNYQPSPEDINNAAPLYDKSFWSTPTYEATYREKLYLMPGQEEALGDFIDLILPLLPVAIKRNRGL